MIGDPEEGRKLVTKAERDKFPQYLFVHEPIKFGNQAKATEPFEGYPEWEDAEEDDTIAVYQLVKVCRLKIEKKKTLEE